MNWYPDNENVSTATDLDNNNNNNNNKKNNKKLSKWQKLVYKNQEPYNEYFLTMLTTSLINLSCDMQLTLIKFSKKLKK